MAYPIKGIAARGFFIAAMLCGAPASAQMTEQIFSSLERFAQNIATCYGQRQMAFGQRVLQRKFVEDYLKDCKGTSAQARRLEAAFIYDSSIAEQCNMDLLFHNKDDLVLQRSRKQC